MTLLELLGNSVVGFCLVFVILVLLMVFVLLINAIFKTKEKPKNKAEETAVKPTATGLPEVILENVSEPDAAMIMAIVADSSGIPVEKLRFISIKEVE